MMKTMDGMNDMGSKPAAPPGNSGEMCVPTESLSMPDDQEQMVAPEVGDTVTLSVEGKVTRIEGGKAYVEPMTINGKDLPGEEKGEPGPAGADEGDMEKEGAALSKMAEESAGGGY